jgi:predicted TIM-barrel fold metal-dependent hydrolase
MQRRGLIYDTVAHQDTLPAAAQTVERFGEMSFVLEHAGWPTAADAETFTIWKAGIEAVAKAPNAAAKISGLMMPLGRFDLDTLRPWVLATIEAFGADRCMFASNFPVDWLWVEYGDLMDGYAEIVADFSEDERAAMFAGNAERWYRI